MNLELSETQTLLQRTVRDFLREEVPFERVRSCERENQWDAALWNAIAEQGWLGIAFSENLGGAGGSFVDLGLWVEEFAQRAAIVPVLEVSTCGRILQDFADAEESRRWIEPILAGLALPVPAILESDDDFESIRAEVVDGVLTGAKTYVDYAQFATHHLVAARSPEGIGLWLVDARNAGVQVEPLRSIGRTPVGSVRYAGVPAQAVGDHSAYRALLRMARALAAVQCLGSMQTALNQTTAYAKLRKQFGKPIGSFQAVRHHCANMAIRIESVRGLCYSALSSLDSPQPSDERIDSAKASASLAAPEVTMLAHQIHGGNGVIEENDLYFFTLRAKERSLAWGSSVECLDNIAQGVAAPTDWL